MRGRRTLTLSTALVLSVAVAGPAPASNRVSVAGSTIHIEVPVQVRGAIEGPDGVDALRESALPLSVEALHGCFAVRPEPTAGTEPDVHVVTVLPQRTGQFVRPSFDPDVDPYTASRDITVGALALTAESPASGPLALLLSSRTPSSGGAAGQTFLASVVEETGAAERLKPCRWTGTLELVATYEKYRLRVTASVPFSFTVDAAGAIDGTVQKTTRDATADDPEVGRCTASDLPMFAIALEGEARDGEFRLTFVAKGPERDFEMACSGGTVSIGGDYLRAAFLPTGEIPFDLRQRSGATATAKNRLQGRDATAKVSIKRG